MLANRYLVAQQIGVGGTATVYRVEDLRRPRQLALKIIDFHQTRLGEPDEIERRARTEVAVVTALRNPHIVPIVDVFEIDAHTVAIVMGLAEGETLHAKIQGRKPLDPDTALDVVSQVAMGLAEAHAEGVIHCDVKPDNLMLQELGEGVFFVRIMDFGIAHVGDTDHHVGFLGTPQYASPEQIESGHIGPAADAYGIGATLYFALTGVPPFIRNTTIATMQAHVLDPAPRLCDASGTRFSPDLEAFVASLLAKDPASRPQSMAELISQIEQLRATSDYDQVIESGLNYTSDLIGLSETISEGSLGGGTELAEVTPPLMPIDNRVEAGRLAAIARGRVVSIIDQDVVITTLSPRIVHRSAIDFADIATSLAVSNTGVFVGTSAGWLWSDRDDFWAPISPVPDNAAISAVGSMPNGELTAVGTAAGNVFLLQAVGWHHAATGTAVHDLVISSTGRMLAYSIHDAVFVVDLRRDTVIRVDQPNIVSLAFSDDELLLAMVSRDGAASIWSIGALGARRVSEVSGETPNILAVYFAQDALLGLARDFDGTFVTHLRCRHGRSCSPSCNRCIDR